MIDLGHSHHVTSQVTASFDGLDGTSVPGQSISCDLTFAGENSGRLFTITSSTFEAAITLQTNGSGMLGFLSGTGFLMDANGHAIPGWGPYQRAFDRGVNLIGATCDYATAELDAGPINDQEVIRVDHFHNPEGLARIGVPRARKQAHTCGRHNLDTAALQGVLGMHNCSTMAPVRTSNRSQLAERSEPDTAAHTIPRCIKWARRLATFHDIDGTMLQGQSLSLDVGWNDEKFVRLLSVTDPSFAALLTLQTNGTGLVGFVQGTGFLLDENGQAIGAPMQLGSASSDDGSLAVGLFPLLYNRSGSPLDFFGIHFDLLLPDHASIWLTGGELHLLAAGARPGDRLGIGPGVPTDIVPDVGGKLLLLAAGVAALHGIKIGRPPAPSKHSRCGEPFCASGTVGIRRLVNCCPPLRAAIP